MDYNLKAASSALIGKLIINVNNFGPFNPEVWGTVSDWVMVAVTFITGMLIWLTLRSQMRVQKLQHKSLNLEMQKSRDKIIPVFDARQIEMYQGKGGVYLNKLELTCIMNDCYNLEVKVFTSKKNREGLRIETENASIKRFAKNSSRIFTVINDNYPKVESIEFIIVDFELSFKDMLDNNYSQKISFNQTFDGSFKSKIGEAELTSIN